jgi:hypothetical protein
MFAFLGGDGVAWRSIEVDDVAGVQSIYGALDPQTKPHLTSVSLSGNTVTIAGSNFAASGNEIWFTQAPPAPSGAPVVAPNVPSNGTTLVALLPAGAGAGDVVVKKGGANGPKGLSNALAFDPNACASVTPYCTAGLSTHFCTPAMSASGNPSAAASSGFVLRCDGLEGQRSSLIFYGTGGRAALAWGIGGSSWLCVKAPTQRTPVASSGGTASGCDGSISIDWLAFLAANPGALGNPLQAGTVVDAQTWYRDPPAVKATGLSNGIEFTVCP